VDQAEASLAVPGSRAERELEQFVERRHYQRESGAEDLFGDTLVEDYNLEEEWKALAADHARDRQATVAELWCRFHLRQAARLRSTLGALVEHHEQQARRWEGS
jgi:hypothetical protein